jgi:phosphoribosylformylglycinamidine synthase
MKKWQMHGLTPEEYQAIQQQMGREPNDLELTLFGVMWSEHCSYKHTRHLLQQLPSQGPLVVQGPGENAGVIKAGDDLGVAFKIESHNHPSAVDPFQGAATGVGGIVRDVVSMGARPIALLNSLRLGPLDNEHNRWLLQGIVGGMAAYGNFLEVPTVGGEIYFASCYSNNPLVNAMCIGCPHRQGRHCRSCLCLGRIGCRHCPRSFRNAGGGSPGGQGLDGSLP